MIILHQEMRARPEKCDEVMAALAAIIPGARATEGVVKLDIARDLLDPDSFVATGVYEDGAALERQESAPDVHRAVAMFADSLAPPPDRRIYDASRDPSLVEIRPRLPATRHGVQKGNLAQRIARKVACTWPGSGPRSTPRAYWPGSRMPSGASAT